MDLKMGVLIGLIVGGVLLAAMVPTALSALYKTSSDTFRPGYTGSTDVNGKAIAANVNISVDTATAAMWNIMPLFTALAALALLLGFGLKEFGYLK